jgi:retron-type reverse transcriptase
VQSLEAYGEQLDEQLEQLRRELKENAYQPQPVRQAPIPKVGGKSDEQRMLGVPTVRDRVCQQALLTALLKPARDGVNPMAPYGLLTDGGIAAISLFVLF